MSYVPGFPFIIISAELKHADEEQNAFTTNMLAHALRAKRLTFDRCLGRYKGEREVSFRICLNQYDIEECNSGWPRGRRSRKLGGAWARRPA